MRSSIALLGRSYEDIDAVAKANDQLIFRQYVAANKTDAQLLAEFQAQYAGWNETWTDRRAHVDFNFPVTHSECASHCEADASDIEIILTFRVFRCHGARQ